MLLVGLYRHFSDAKYLRVSRVNTINPLINRPHLRRRIQTSTVNKNVSPRKFITQSTYRQEAAGPKIPPITNTHQTQAFLKKVIPNMVKHAAIALRYSTCPDGEHIEKYL